MDNRFELVFNERDDASELKNLPIDDNMHGIIEEEERSDEGSDEDEENDAAGIWMQKWAPHLGHYSGRFAAVANYNHIHTIFNSNALESSSILALTETSQLDSTSPKTVALKLPMMTVKMKF